MERRGNIDTHSEHAKDDRREEALYHITSLLEKFIGYREEYIRCLYYYFVFMFSMHVFMFVNVFFVYVINEYY